MNEFLEPDEPATAVAPRRRGLVRWLVRCVCLAAAVAALWPLAGHAQTMRWVAAVSPFVTAASLLAGCACGIAAIVALGIAVVAIFRRRWFCRWMCPTGLCADVAGRLGRRCRLRCPRLPRIGQWIAVATLAGACVGYPLFLWLDPLAIFSGTFSVVERGRGADGRDAEQPIEDDPARPPPAPARVWWTAAGVPAVVLLSLLLPGVWCGRLCPLGGMQELLWSAARIPLGARPSRPLDAGGTPALPGTRALPGTAALPSRRFALRVVLGAIIGLVWAIVARTARAAMPRPLRPPGARDELRFLGLCVRCGNCVRACPVGILAPDAGQHGIAGLLAPEVSFENDYCREDCALCTEVCPSGALRPLVPADKLSAPLGLARVNKDLCLLVKGQECFVCKNQCPLEAISIQPRDEDGYDLEPVVDPRKCSGCGACQLFCPTAPVKAIVVQPFDTCGGRC